MNNNLALLEENYKQISNNLTHWPNESTVFVNLKILHELHLLHYHTKNYNDPKLTRYFQVIETAEKITLVNDDFVVWIVPIKDNNISYTRTLIALNKGETPQLELIVITNGVYNTSRLVLRILEKQLFDIQEIEMEINSIKKSSKKM